MFHVGLNENENRDLMGFDSQNLIQNAKLWKMVFK